ncbi:MAG: hypothetical protein ABEJ68_05460 [Halobacteriaceae archaeon]
MGVTDTVRLRLGRRRLAESEIYDVLQNDRRRRALVCLRERTGEVHLRDLAEFIAAFESGERPPPKSCTESVYNSLHQTHLPKLAALDVVTYDESSKQVRLTTNAPEIDRYLRVRGPYGFSAGECYQLLAVTTLLAALFAELDVAVFAAVETLAVLTLSLGVFAVVAAYQTWRRRWLYVRSLLG